LCCALRAETNGGYCAPDHLRAVTDWDKIQHGGKYLQSLKTGKMLPVKYSLASFFADLFPGRPLPNVCIYYRCGLFACTKKCILSNSKSFYIHALSLIPEHPDPEIGHYFERIWYNMFNDKNFWTYQS
jgi:hypothetical protein